MNTIYGPQLPTEADLYAARHRLVPFTAGTWEQFAAASNAYDATFAAWARTVQPEAEAGQ